MNNGLRTAWLLMPLLAWLWPLHTFAETVAAQLPGGRSVIADYRHGSSGKPAVLVLHGFLTTNGFNTVHAMTNELADAGYTVLAPTLSLGINNRKASLPCDAIHTHTMEEDVAELDFWVHWLVSQGAHNIVLVGHSTGGLQMVIYAANHPHPAVRQLVTTSLINIQDYGQHETIARESKQARQLLAQQRPPLHSYHLVYCESFNATPHAYLSYIQWSPQKVLSTLKQRKLPVYAIMAGQDDRFGQKWIAALRSTGIDVHVIPEANHFFDGPQEFELQDVLKKYLSAPRQR